MTNPFKKPRNLILGLLLLGFFLPWISYGFISKSGFAIPFSPHELQSLLKLAYMFDPELKTQITIPKEAFYLYWLYLYPVVVTLLFFIRSRAFTILVALIPIVPYFIASTILPIDLFTFMGIGFMLTLAMSVALIIESLIFKKRSV